jgi:ABC-type dipeptide/oligopeptide/nickel transport system permease subunit
MSISVLGVSTASFLFAMMLWVVNIWVHRTFAIQVLPSAGYGWDAHLLMPVLVLAMRPMAQLAQVTYVTMSEILKQDYVRTAHSKGLSWRAVRNVHVIPNILIPILNTLGSSLRFSLASLPVVELFFDWPGVGVMLLDAINAGTTDLVIDLILSLGSFFLLVNLLIEFSFPLIDPRLRREVEAESRDEAQSPLDTVREAINIVSAWFRDLGQGFRRKPRRLPALIVRATEGSTVSGATEGSAVSGATEGSAVSGVTGIGRPAAARAAPDLPPPAQGRWMLRNFVRNPALIIGSITVLTLVGLALFGENLTDADPYQVHGIMPIEGQFYAPPFEPSSVFPWGADHLGRDIRALVLAGGRRTLSLAFFGMLARMLLGATLGLLAGWQRDGWFDRLVTGAMGVWAAFPVTLFAMIVIQGLGIQQGMWVFVVAICIVGWGEVAQFVRGQVIALKPQAFIESARAVGARTDQILVRHVVPNLVNTFIVLASLEMAGVLMLLAELGFLNIFMGGGFRAMIGEAGRMMPVIAFYSDVPEWAALIANVRQYWRSYPWMALYPGLAVFLSIVGLNLFGEGLRRFLEDCHVNLSRLFNRYTFTAMAGLGVVIALVLQSAGPLSLYRAEGLKFDEARVLQDIQMLSAAEIQGRETGMPGAELASIYLAQRMAQTGIFPAGEHHDYYQRLVQPRLHLLEMPTLSLIGDSLSPPREFTYRRDFTELARNNLGRGTAQAPIMGVAFGPIVDAAASDAFGFSNSSAMDHVIIVRAEDLPKVNTRQVKGVLVIEGQSHTLERRDVYPYILVRNEIIRPHLLISAQVADDLLKTAGTSLAQLDAARLALAAGEITTTAEGASVKVSLEPRRADDYLNEVYINVLGVIPGQGRLIGLEEQVIVVSAYYDGLGTDLTGQVFPGANDNASGVATMLELARLLKESHYQPDKTVLFVAWAGGERQEGLSVVNVLNARPGANKLTVESVLELSGVGYGTGKSVSIGNESSYRLVKLVQAAASRYDVPTTTRGRGPHYDLPALNVFGGREAMTLSLSWDGSDSLAHTPRDTFATIDPLKLRAVGRTAFLTLLVLCRETDY